MHSLLEKAVCLNCRRLLPDGTGWDESKELSGWELRLTIDDGTNDLRDLPLAKKKLATREETATPARARPGATRCRHTWWILPSPTPAVEANRLPCSRDGVMKLGRTVRGVVRDERATRAARAKLALQQGRERKKERKKRQLSIHFCVKVHVRRIAEANASHSRALTS